MHISRYRLTNHIWRLSFCLLHMNSHIHVLCSWTHKYYQIDVDKCYVLRRTDQNMSDSVIDE